MVPLGPTTRKQLLGIAGVRGNSSFVTTPICHCKQQLELILRPVLCVLALPGASLPCLVILLQLATRCRVERGPRLLCRSGFFSWKAVDRASATGYFLEATGKSYFSLPPIFLDKDF